MEACERDADAQTLTDLAAAAAAAALRDSCNGSEIRAHVGNISYRPGCCGELLPSDRPSVRLSEREPDPEKSLKKKTKKNNNIK